LRSQNCEKDKEEIRKDENYESDGKMPVFKIPKVPEISNHPKVPLPVENFQPIKIKKVKPQVKKLHKNSKAYKNSIANLQIPQKSTKLFELLTEGVKKRRKSEPKIEKPHLNFSIDHILGLDRCKK
jgi:hypothetical protein